MKKDKLKAEHERNLIIITSNETKLAMENQCKKSSLDEKTVTAEIEALIQKCAEQEAFG